jgi:acetyl-CoA C-acetyltransferase
MPPEWLASTVLSAVIDRSGIDPIRIEDVAMARVDGGRASAQELSRPGRARRSGCRSRCWVS